MNMTTDELESALRGATPDRLTAETLHDIRRAGGRRRTARRALTGVAALAAASLVGAVLVGTGLGAGGGTGGTGVDEAAAPPSRPSGLEPWQERVLREIPGAEQISPWQVSIPEPAGAREPYTSTLAQDGARVETSMELGVPAYSGVTAYRPRDFPEWLYGHVDRAEIAAGDGQGRPVGSTDVGVVVRAGTLELGCVIFEDSGSTECGPAVVQRRTDGEMTYRYGFGTEDFLRPGAGMEVFAGNPGDDDAPTLVTAGIDGDDVARVEFVTTLGEVVEGGVSHDLTASGDDSIMWGWVPGAVAAVIAYDAAGEVVDRHELRECGSGVDCEVR